MKKHLFLTILLSFFFYGAFAQKEYKFLEEAKQLAIYSTTIREHGGERVEHKQKSILLIGSMYSHFCSERVLIEDTTVHFGHFKPKDMDWYINFTKSLPEDNLKVKVITESRVKAETFLSVIETYTYEESLPIITWNMTGKTDSVSGFLCQQAVCEYSGRTYEAWFTLQVPIPLGPYKFGGLPGLIVKIESEDGEYSFVLESLTQKALPILKQSSNIITTKREKAWKAHREYNTNPLNQLKSRYPSFDISNIPEEERKRIKEESEKSYNPIEIISKK